ncbi:MAG: DNA polymerase III subunit alpha [Candidatus Krumholzibacteriota bacterium]|nr:DNA polymerase III subunit alpha [Candidatus Krumholzibacteriota bacterium]
MPYIPLHVHSVNSPYRGMMTVEELVSRASFLKLPAVALTDQWTNYGHCEFQEKAKRSGINPVFGAEIQHQSLTGADGYYHLTVLAENNRGYANLASLISHHYQKEKVPHVTESELVRYREGLIVLTGCLRGEANQAVLHGNLGRERAAVEKLLQIYGCGNVYLEIMTHNLEKEQFALDKMILLSGKLKIPMVVTNNDRYLQKDQAVYYSILRKLAGDKEDSDNGNSEYWFKKEKDLEPFFYTVNEALQESGRIAERCRVELNTSLTINFPEGFQAHEKLADMCSRRFLLKFHGCKAQEKSYLKNLISNELRSAERERVSAYLLFLSRLFRVCDGHGLWIELMGGDLLESFIAYLLNITSLNPVEHDLIFESFNSSRPGVPPALDLVKARGTREIFLRILRSQLGGHSIFYQVSREEMSFSTLAKELGEVLGMDRQRHEELLKVLSLTRRKQSLAGLLESSEQLMHLYNADKMVRKILHSSQALQGRIFHFNLNSSRLIIFPREADKMISHMAGAGEIPFALADNAAVEGWGGWVLGLQHSHFLSALEGTVKALEAERGPGETRERKAEGWKGRWNPAALHDAETLSLIAEGDTAGVYLLESRGIRELLTKIKPSDFDELVNVISLYRPGPLEGKLWQRYIENSEKTGKVYLPHHSMASALEKTRGLLLYREQVREIIKNSAGLTGEKAVRIERTLRDGKAGDLLSSRLNFIRGAMENGIDEEDAQKIFDYLLHNFKFTYNKALSCAQAYISYRTAFMKAHYLEYYFSALLNSSGDVKDRQSKYFDYLESINRPVLPADVNFSRVKYIREKGGIRAPLNEAHTLSDSELEALLTDREENGPYPSLEDFLNRMSGQLPMDSVKGMIDAGLFDYLRINRSELRDECLAFYEKHAKAGEFFRTKTDPTHARKNKDSTTQLSFFDEDDI